MANALYDKGREKFLKGLISWDSDNIKAVLVNTDAGYAVDLANDEFLSDIAGGDRLATSGNFASKTTAAGVADADDITFSSLTVTDADAIVIYKDTGSAATSPLIAYIDTATGLPLTSTGGDATIVWSSGASKIFKL